MREVLVRCGGAHARRPSGAQLLELDVAAPKTSPSRVNLGLEHITSPMVQDVPDALADLLEIACYVYCADQFTRRDTPKMVQLGGNWRRYFSFTIPVRNPEFWNRPDVSKALTTGLAFLSEDAYEFTFTLKAFRTGLQPYLDLHADGPPAGFTPDKVVLFSGGIDSLAGAAQALISNGERLVLVSHQSAPMLRAKQLDLVDALRQRTSGSKAFHVSVAVNKGKQNALEFTQRSRSFLFAVLGFVVARLFRKTEVTFFENGILSMNLPIATHVIGARATRTTHPRVLSDFGKLFSLIANEEIRVVNPFFWFTKAEVTNVLRNIQCADLIPRSFSCTRVREATKKGAHCGLCSQCVDRRFSVLAAGLGEHEPADTYEMDLLRGERPPGRDVTLAESYYLSAVRFEGLSPVAFGARYGEVFRALPYLEGPPEKNLKALYELHARHGASVGRVVQEAIASCTGNEMLALPHTSLLALVQSNVGDTRIQLDPVENEPAASEQARSSKIGPVERPVRFAVDDANQHIVFAPGIRLTKSGYRLFKALLPEFNADRDKGCPPKKCGFVPAGRLAERLRVEEPTIRQSVRRIRSALSCAFREQGKGVLDDQDIIETKSWLGYRLNPYLEARPLPFVLGSGSHLQVSRNRPGSVTTHRSRP